MDATYTTVLISVRFALNPAGASLPVTSIAELRRAVRRANASVVDSNTVPFYNMDRFRAPAGPPPARIRKGYKVQHTSDIRTVTLQ